MRLPCWLDTKTMSKLVHLGADEIWPLIQEMDESDADFSLEIDEDWWAQYIHISRRFWAMHATLREAWDHRDE